MGLQVGVISLLYLMGRHIGKMYLQLVEVKKENTKLRMDIESLIKEEQKRIASEIHDGVSQRLFGVVSAAYALKVDTKFSEERIREQLELISESANKAMQELRLIIYGLYYRQETRNSFFQNVTEYLKDAAHLNSQDIDVELNGDEKKLNISMKRGIFRIIKEATGNAIRHGQCTQIYVRLEVDGSSSNLIIQDNGQGFDYKAIGNKGWGLGLRNIEGLVTSLQGNFLIESGEGKGTSIRITIPLNRVREIIRGDHFVGGVAS